MSNVIYIKGDLFNATKGSVLAHAVNGQGVWGSGIAKQFKEHFPISFNAYKMVCNTLRKNSIPGLALSFAKENGYTVLALFTSENYGDKVSSPDVILSNTYSCFEDLMDHSDIREIHMPKINSGLFNVPWELTEKVLLEFPEITFYVYSQV
jgi:ADP-ribose 1''-phosphate phosphatase